MEMENFRAAKMDEISSQNILNTIGPLLAIRGITDQLLSKIQFCILAEQME